MAGRVVVVGLGPAGVDLLLPASRVALERSRVRFARTERHPAVAELRAAGLELPAFDAIYDAANSVEAVYPAIVEHLIGAATESGEVAYAVPGSPTVAERSVALLRSAAGRGTIELELVPGLSFVDLALTRLGVDPMTAGLDVLDAHDPVAASALTGPALIAQCDHPLVLADLKLALLEQLPPDTPVVVLARLGLADERVEPVVLAELDRVPADHLTTIFVDAAPRGAVRELARLLELAVRLRGPGGCPWDAEQTHHSLSRYLLEEAYEVVEAVETLPADAPSAAVDPVAYAALADELGDLLYQVIFHAVLAAEVDGFDMADVARGIHDKLVRRHPHVFGDVEADSSAAVMRNWEQIKKDEKGDRSIVAGITPGLPALLYAHKLYRKAASVGLDPGDTQDALARLRTATARLEGAPGEHAEPALGELLAAAVVYARACGIDAESALTGWARRFRRRFEAVEARADERGLDLATLDPVTMGSWWEEAAAVPNDDAG